LGKLGVGRIDDEVDLSKEPFSKLKRDMARELGLR